MAGKKILVTGADGFIGSHLCEELIKKGCSVRAFVFYNSFNSQGWLDSLDKETINNLEVFSGDIRDFHAVFQAMQGCQVVMHLAALVSVPYSYSSPDSYVDTNIKGTMNILQAARKLGVEKVVHTSSSEVYGSARYVPIDEEHPLQGQSPYSATKIAADQLAMSFYDSFATPVAIIRPFNTYGPRQSARAVIPTVITQIASGQNKIKLGATYPTRDFNYIKDTVRGFTAVAEVDAAAGQIINIGTNYEISIGDLVKTIADVMEVKIEIESDPGRIRPLKSEVQRLLADNSKARNILGWKPEFSGYEGLKQGLRETIGWFRNPDNLKKYNPCVYNL
ncbi:MAG: NAD-dependent 4,6-dehydratase LegB [Syntrophomonadaceae bacterium]|nr:NAD-dependent 4,6-dehydratase LegB [Syntrophomonadaceae bacterium]